MCKSEITPICKECARKIAYRVDKHGDRHQPTKDSVIESLRYLNKPFLNAVWDASVQESQNLITGKIRTSVFQSYVKNIAMQQYLTLTFKDSDFFKQKIVYDDQRSLQEVIQDNIGVDSYDDYLKNKKDVTRLLGYDPFDKEAVSDQPFLYAQLIGLIDQGGDQNDDMLRNNSCVSIVRAFLQSQKIDNTITKMMSDIHNIQKNSATIKSLQDSKQKLTSMITNLAAQSCISLKNSRNAKKGESTWTGKLKKVKDLDLREGRLNGFEIETAKAMRQIMDLSNASILNQLRLDESDWSDMVAQQRQIITDLQSNLDKYIEISRILLAQNLDLKDFIKDNNLNDSGYKYVSLDELYSRYSAEQGGNVNEPE